MTAIVDYGVGNLFSLHASFRAVGENAVVTGDPKVIHEAERIVLPGVGAFRDAAARLEGSGLGEVVKAEAANGKPLIGICLGMQLLFEKSLEFGEYAGLDLLRGEVVPIENDIPAGLKIPHIGWNALIFPENKHHIFKYVNEGDCVYFVHSFHASGCEDSVIARTEYGGLLTAAVARENVYGCQFHPEKSGPVGLGILKAFCETRCSL